MNNSDSCMVSQIIIGIDKDYNFYSKSQGWGGGGLPIHHLRQRRLCRTAEFRMNKMASVFFKAIYLL